MSQWGSRGWPAVGRVCMLGAVLWLAGPTSGRAAVQGEWVATGPPIAGLASGGTVIVLPDGTPLLLGLSAAAVQRYHPDTGAWTPSGSLQTPLESLTPGRGTGATVTVLPSGLVLLAGGAGAAATTAELYDPATGVSTYTGDMHLARANHRATLLASGQVLVSGGIAASGQFVGPTEIYDPLAGTWSLTGALNNARADHAAVRLPSGSVFVAGGSGPNGSLASAEIYGPVTGTWAPASTMDRPRPNPRGVSLQDGRVLVAGTASSELYDPVADVWTPSITIPDAGPDVSALVILPDGSPLALSTTVFCGVSNCVFFTTAATLDLHAGFWTLTPPLEFPRARLELSHGSSLAMLPDGRALLASQAGAELFRPDHSTPRLVVSPLTVDLGETSPGSAVQQAVSLRNTGGATLTGSVTTAPPFSALSGSPFTLAPGASTIVAVQFTPSGFGAFSGIVQFMSSGNWLAVAVTGAAGVRVSGRVTGTAGAGISGVTVDLTGGATATTVTDAAGEYQFFVPPNNGYNVTPTSPGLAFTPGVRSVLIGTQNVSGLSFVASVADAVAAFVADLYAEVLGRPPDAPGLAGWTAFLHQHCDTDGVRAVADAFFDSSELRTSRPLTLPGLVTTLYRALLAREPEPGGLAAGVDVFRQERRALARDFIGSAEFQRLLPNRASRPAVTAVVTRFYTEMLGRAPDAVGLTGWVDYIVATGDVEGTAGEFVTSEEFEARALTFRDYVTILYGGILGRDPDPNGLDAGERPFRFDLLSIRQDAAARRPADSQ